VIVMVLKSMKLVANVIIKREGKIVKVRRATQHFDTDRGSEYYTYDNTITTRALITNVSGWSEIFYPYGRAYEGDYLVMFRTDDTIDVHDRVLYDDLEYKINERHQRNDFIEIVMERV